MSRSLAWIVALSLSPCPSVLGQAQAYVIPNDLRTLEQVNLTTGVTSSGPSLVNSGVGDTTGLTWRGDTDEFWAAQSNLPAEIGTIDTFSGMFTPRFFTNRVTWQALAWDPVGRRFFLSFLESQGSDLWFIYSLDPFAGTLQQIGGGVPYPLGILTMEADSSGTLWGVNARSQLVVIDKTNGSFQWVSNISAPVRHLSINRTTGEFFGTGGNGSESLMTIEPATGQATIRGGFHSPYRGFAIVDGVCAGRFLEYGAGCAGSGGVVPTLDAYGCFGWSGDIVLRMQDAVSGTAGVIVFGLDSAQIPLGRGCFLQITPILPAPILAFSLFGTGGAGNGFMSVPIRIPPGTHLVPFTMQGLVLDPGVAAQFAVTNALRVVMP